MLVTELQSFSEISPPHLNVTNLISFKKLLSCIVIIILNRMYNKLIKSKTTGGVARCHLLKNVKTCLAFSKP